ncbi:MAG: NAD-binding protein [Hyphomonadaceae bacterium]
MARRYGNLWSNAASGLTAIAHRGASAPRWIIIALLTLLWIGGGLSYWMSGDRARDVAQAFYLTIAAVGMWDAYFGAEFNGQPIDWQLQAVRFAAIAIPVVGLLFAFSGQLGRSLARILNQWAARHIVIAGESDAALSLAADCRKHRDAVIVIARDLPAETALGLRRNGVTVLEGNAAHGETLKSARAHHAAHVIAFAPDDSANLQIEAAVRRLVGKGRRNPPIGVHVSTRSAMLLKEAREMRSAQMRKTSDKSAIDPKPFSLDEMAARALIQKESFALLSLAHELKQERLHVVFFGFDAAAEAVAERVLMSLWSAHFGPPRITVLAPEHEAAEAGFRARHREAFAHGGLWSADVAFMRFDWDANSVGPELLDAVETARGKPTALVVSTGADPGNIHLAIALKRACNHGLRWPVPIFMREQSQSEFSQQYARGDDTPELDAYLQAFGAHQVVATRARVIDGALDRAAAIAHEHYGKGLGKRDPMSMRDLQAAMKDWADVLETYRAANRAVADAAMVKLWDAGWRPAQKGEEGGAPGVDDGVMDAMARREHDRWMAERLMSGWRPTGENEARNNDLMAHDKLVGWDDLSESDRENDRVQVRAAMDIARLTHKDGFVRR